MGGRGNKARPNRSGFRSGSTKAADTLARLKRDRPDLAARELLTNTNQTSTPTMRTE
jgi:hypothetical protein